MSSELEKLAWTVRTIADGTSPVHQALDSAKVRSRRLASAVPRTASAGAAAGSLSNAAFSCEQATRGLHSFGQGCRSFADRLVGGGLSATPVGVDRGTADTTATGNVPQNTALLDALAAQGLELGAVEAFDYADNPVLGYGKAPAEEIAYAVQAWNDQIAPGIANGATREDFATWDDARGLVGHHRLSNVYDYFLGSEAIHSGGTTSRNGLDVGGGRHRLEQAKALGVKYLPFRRR